MDPVDINHRSSFTVDVAFSDPAGADDETYTCRFDMDSDGAIDISVAGVTGTSCNTTLSYTEPGVYSVTVTVEDKDDGVSGATSATEFLVIYDPEGGFVTGGGWIDSPQGACTFQDCTDDTTGTAHFGFVSKYKKGASVPTGNTQFQFQAGDLSFHSTSYDWLVIAGAKAMYKGNGSVNGVAGYGFQINAIDGQINGGGGIDKFRIRITESGGGVIYDNNRGAGDNDDPATELVGGSIKIHNAQNLTLKTGAGPQVFGVPLAQVMLDDAVAQAVAYWSEQGVTPEEANMLEHIDVHIADLEGSVLGRPPKAIIRFGLTTMRQATAGHWTLPIPTSRAPVPWIYCPRLSTSLVICWDGSTTYWIQRLMSACVIFRSLSRLRAAPTGMVCSINST